MQVMNPAPLAKLVRLGFPGVTANLEDVNHATQA
jgi:hypothetical protein